MKMNQTCDYASVSGRLMWLGEQIADLRRDYAFYKNLQRVSRKPEYYNEVFETTEALAEKYNDEMEDILNGSGE